MPGSLGHLASRFFDYLRAKPLTREEGDWVRTKLEEPERALFFAQSAPDQRHGYDAGRYVLTEGADPVTVRAALLHDVGKRHGALGVVGRSVASVLIKSGLPMSYRMRQYRDHGESGAVDLGVAGAPPLIVEFARYHHSVRPEGFDPAAWDLLQRADQPANTRTSRHSRIT